MGLVPYRQVKFPEVVLRIEPARKLKEALKIGKTGVSSQGMDSLVARDGDFTHK